MGAKKKTSAERFSERLREVAEAKGLNLDGLVRLSPRFKFGATSRWWHGTRFPKAPSIVDLAQALEMEPSEFIKDMGLDLRTVAEVEAIARAEKPNGVVG